MVLVSTSFTWAQSSCLSDVYITNISCNTSASMMALKQLILLIDMVSRCYDINLSSQFLMLIKVPLRYTWIDNVYSLFILSCDHISEWEVFYCLPLYDRSWIAFVMQIRKCFYFFFHSSNHLIIEFLSVIYSFVLFITLVTLSKLYGLNVI